MEEDKVAGDIFLKAIVNPKIGNAPVVTSKAPLKVEMQTLRLDTKSQKSIMETLKHIHGQDFVLTDASNYEDKHSNLGKNYWLERGNLVIKSACDYSRIENVELSTEDKLRQFALQKLESYGFFMSHCKEALDFCNGELESALRILFHKYFKIDEISTTYKHDLSSEELLQQRIDEAAVLESIYENAFSEIIPNKVWNLKFKINYLVEMFSNNIPEKKNVTLSANKKKIPKCRNFGSGKCKFGNKCRFSHEIKEEEPKSKDFLADYIFELEIRFSDQSEYPYEIPMILLKTNFPNISNITRLKLCRRLIEEACSFAKDGIPSVYSLGELLTSEEEMVAFLKNCNFRFITESEMLFPPVADKENNNKKNLPSHHTKGTTYKDMKTLLSLEEISKEDDRIVKSFFKMQKETKYKQFLEVRRKLPAWDYMEKILSAVDNSQVIVISGETGCGKSTQVPQFILDDWLINYESCKSHVEIVCTQPRRISAIGVAERVADERNERAGNTVGYQIRLESKVSASTRLTFCTTGILLRRLEGDPLLSNVSHLIIDEVHERSEESDFLLLILRDLLPLRPDLRVILMSATLNADLFSNYFDSVPVLEIPGKTFPVEQLFLEDILEMTGFVIEENSQYTRKIKCFENELQTSEVQSANEKPKPTLNDDVLNLAQMLARYEGYSMQTCKNLYLLDSEQVNFDLIEAILIWIVSDDRQCQKTGSVLIFLPGISEISTLHDQLKNNSEFNPANNKYVLLPLHSTLTGEEQAAVFKKPKNGARKIILSTNIAETSITIDDCIYVIDCGKMKEKRFDSNRNMESLDTVWVSRANALQRKGRAGRVMAGICIHLFTRHRFKHHLLPQPIPELHRIPLEPILMRIRILPNFENKTLHGVLDNIIEPPSKESIDSAILRLQDIGAFDKEQNLTPLGQHLASLPVDVRIGKLMLFGAIFCCLDSSLTMAACLSYKSPFVTPFSQKKQADSKKQKFALANSDQLTILNAYRKWQDVSSRSVSASYNFAQENYLSVKTMIMLADIKHQLLELLVSIGFVPADLRVPRRTGQDKVLTITGQEINANGNNNKLLAAILCAALYPNVVKVLTPGKSFEMSSTGAVPRHPKPEELKFKTKEDGYVNVHPSSVVYSIGSFPSPYLVYQEKVKTSRIFIRDCCMVPLLPLVLFSGCSLTIERHSGVSIISLEDGWIIFQTEEHEVAEMLKAIRQELIMLLEEKIRDPCLNLMHHVNGKKIISTIVNVIANN